MPITSQLIRWGFIMIFLITAALPAVAQPAGKRKPPPPGPAYTLPPETVRNLKNAWDRCGNPSVIISVGVIKNNTIVFSEKHEAVARLESVIRGELSRAFNNVVDLESVRKHDDRILASMQRSAGTAVAPDLDKILARHFDAQLQLEVLFRPRNGKLYIESWALRDLAASSYIGTGTLGRNDILSRIGADKVIGTLVCQKFADAFIPSCNEPARTYHIRALAQVSKADKTERTLRRLARDIQNEFPNEVKWAKVETEVQDGVIYANFSIRYDGPFRDLLFDIEDYILEEKELGWSFIIQTPRDAGVYIFKAERPTWHILTDPDESPAQDAIRIRQALQGGNRLGIVVGSDIADPEGYFDPDGKPEPSSKTWENAALRSALVNVFTDLGLTVQADDSIRKRLNTLRNNAKRYDSAPHLIEALGDLSSLDYLLHVNIDNSVTDSLRLIARLYDPRDASEIAQQIWPSPTANRLSNYSVDEQRPEELARFLAGRLVERWDRKRTDNYATTLVRVRNVKQAESVLGLSSLLRDSVRGIHAVTDLQISGPAASFEIVHEGDTDQLLFSAIDRIGLAYPGVEIQLLNGVLVVNLNPIVLTEQARAAVRERRISLKPNEVIAAQPVVDAPPQIIASQDRVAQALKDARESVWLVVIESEKKGWERYGTAWTVGDGLLATNAHVVGNVPERRERGENFYMYAINDSDRSQRIELGKAWRHPQWKDENSANSWFDVGLIKVTKGDAGKPLPLASADELNQLVPPIIVGYVGFPSKGVIKAGGGKQSKQAFLGQINAVVDTQLIARKNATNYMVMHNLLTASGASGSPILGPSGQVIAIHNSGGQAAVSGKISRKKDDSDRDDNKKEDPDTVLIGVKSGFNGAIRIDTLSRFIQSLGDEIK